MLLYSLVIDTSSHGSGRADHKAKKDYPYQIIDTSSHSSGVPTTKAKKDYPCQIYALNDLN